MIETQPLNARRTVDAVIVGAGFAGLYAIYSLTRLGLKVQAFEAGQDVGGTWYWNRYPGARCDVESEEYSYSFSDELDREWRWSARYAEQPEIHAYLRHVADRFDLRRHIGFETRVVSQVWDETRGIWTVTTNDGAQIEARFCVMASGNLTVPNYPDIPGLDQFGGTIYHSARWPQDAADFTGKRVALFGTGSTGIQIAPKVAAQAAHLYVFQRTPNFSIPAGPLGKLEAATAVPAHERRRKARATPFGLSNAVLSQQSALDATEAEREIKFETVWKSGGSQPFLATFRDLLTDIQANHTAADFVRRKIGQMVKDPATVQMLSSQDYPIGTKRPCVDTDYFATFNRPNVSLVDLRKTPIERITPTGIRTEGAELQVDALIFATGFDAITGALRNIAIQGRDMSLTEKWQDGPSTYLGLMTAGFPNLFIITGPGSPGVKSNMVCSIEHNVDWIADCISWMNRNAVSHIEPTAEAEQDWGRQVSEVAHRTLFPLADTWYNGANIPGKPRVFMPYVGGLHNYIAACDEIAAADYQGFVKAYATGEQSPERSQFAGLT